MKMVIKSKDLACLQMQLKASKEEIQKAIATVGNNPDDIEQYLQRKAKPHLMQLLHSNINVHPH